MRTRHFFAGVVIAVASCATEPTDPVAPDAPVVVGAVTLANDIQPILDKYCTRCHAFGAGNPHGEPHFTRDASAGALQTMSDCTHAGTRVRLVVPGNPESSFLLYKLGMQTNLDVTGTTCQQRMPLGAEALAETDPAAVARIRQWILDGAP